jgi:hypothetical protein
MQLVKELQLNINTYIHEKRRYNNLANVLRLTLMVMVVMFLLALYIPGRPFISSFAGAMSLGVAIAIVLGPYCRSSYWQGIDLISLGIMCLPFMLVMVFTTASDRPEYVYEYALSFIGVWLGVVMFRDLRHQDYTRDLANQANRLVIDERIYIAKLSMASGKRDQEIDKLYKQSSERLKIQIPEFILPSLTVIVLSLYLVGIAGIGAVLLLDMIATESAIYWRTLHSYSAFYMISFIYAGLYVAYKSINALKFFLMLSSLAAITIATMVFVAQWQLVLISVFSIHSICFAYYLHGYKSEYAADLKESFYNEEISSRHYLTLYINSIENPALWSQISCHFKNDGKINNKEAISLFK